MPWFSVQGKRAEVYSGHSSNEPIAHVSFGGPHLLWHGAVFGGEVFEGGESVREAKEAVEKELKNIGWWEG